MFSTTVIFILAVTYVNCTKDVPCVTTPLGKIQGHYLESYQGNKYKAFEGIPYALPPIGQKRFKDPEPVEPWNETLVANKFKTVCLSLFTIVNIYTDRKIPKGGYTVGVEDCLYLNVYVPMNVKGKLPVLFYIYGGAFQFSSLTGVEQYYLMDHDIIFVSFNHRHGSLGFLSTEDDVIPGNMGLKDQALALRWVSENIEHFGGDPKEITLYGWSSGGAAVHYNYLSPMTAGLFKSGISFSGTAFQSWAQAKDSRAKAIALGKLMGCPTDDMPEMITCLQEQSAENLTITQAKFMPWQLTPIAPFGPVVETDSSNPFIDRSPIEIITSGDIYAAPWIVGTTTEEGLYPVASFVGNDTIMEDLDKNWESIAPHLLDYYYTIPEDKHSIIARRVREYYFGNKTINKDNVQLLVDVLGDRYSTYISVQAVKKQATANGATVWWYLYSYRATDSVSNNLSNSTENFGVCHGDDVFMVIGNVFINPRKTAKDFEMHTELLNFWLSVARTGEPHVPAKWTKLDADSDDFQYLHMVAPGDARLEIHNNLGNREFWESLGFCENIV